MSPSLHPDARAILTRLKQEGITTLYHFTNVENLPSICQMGALYSKQDLEERGLLSTIVTGGDPLSHSLDRTRSNWDKVSLSFTPYIPMAYNTKRSQHLCFFQINPEVAGWLNVVFTDSNATKNGHIRGLGLSTAYHKCFPSLTKSMREDRLGVGGESTCEDPNPLIQFN
jgi:hypothetical protein